MGISNTIGVSILTIIVSILLWMRRAWGYWQRRGVFTPSSSTLYKNMKEAIFQQNSSSNRILYNYRKFKSRGLKHCGIYFLWKPIYIAMDLDIVKSVMQADCQHFLDKGHYYDQKNDPLSAHLFSITGKKWKFLRNEFSPFFTTVQMKMMFECIVEHMNVLIDVLNRNLNDAIEIEDVLGRFAIDVIGTCAFGIDCNSLEDPNSEFRIKGKRFFHRTFFENIKLLTSIVAPKISKKLKLKLTPDEVNDFFMRIATEIDTTRKENNIIKKDLMQILIKLKKKGNLIDAEKLQEENLTEEENEITIKEVAAHVFLFFVAGFETSSTIMSFCLYELAKDNEIKKKLRQEIKQVLAKYNDKISYEAVMEMHYLDMIINESLRKYPPVVCLTRLCTKKFQLPKTDIFLEEGIRVLIPVYGIHHDPEYYPDPEKFVPERFSEENKTTRPAFSFIPFGAGPRVCIGARFGMLQVKLSVIAILLNYEFSVNSKTLEPLEFHTQAFTLSTKGGMWLNLKKINENRNGE